MAAELIQSLLLSLILTEVLEIAFSCLIGVRSSKDLILVLLVNVVTNPAVVLTAYLFRHLTSIPYPCYVIPLELLVVFVEGLYFRRYSESIVHPFRFAFVLNLSSYVTGLLITNVF